MKRILLSLIAVGVVSATTFGITRAYFSDIETSTGNTFAAGTLDLDVDRNNHNNTVKFTLANLRPGNQPKATYTLNNVGTIPGYLDLENIAVTSHENGCSDPELDAGDATCGNPGDGEGELQDVLNMRLFMDINCDGWISTGDTTFYNGPSGGVAGNYELNHLINASGSTCMTALFDWCSTADDNKAMNDSFDLDLTFELAQTTGQ